MTPLTQEQRRLLEHLRRFLSRHWPDAEKQSFPYLRGVGLIKKLLLAEMARLEQEGLP